MSKQSSEDRKQRIAQAFSTKAGGYDSAADVQWLVASRLAERIDDHVGRMRAAVVAAGVGVAIGRCIAEPRIAAGQQPEYEQRLHL